MPVRGRDKHSSFYTPCGEWIRKYRYDAGDSAGRYAAMSKALMDEIRRKIRVKHIAEFEAQVDTCSITSHSG